MSVTLTAAQCAAQTNSLRFPYAIFKLPTLGGVRSYGWTLDARDNVIGGASTSGNDVHATVWIGGQAPQDLGTLGGTFSECRGINTNGWIVGRAENQIGAFRAFLWRNGNMIDLGSLGGSFSEAYGVNDLGQIVGWSSTGDGQSDPLYAFIWQNGKMSQLDITADFGWTYAIAINNAGLIAGQAASYQYTTWRPVIWENGHIQDLGTFRSDNGGLGVAVSVNEAGDVVGYADSTIASGGYRGFLYHNHQMHQLPVRPEWDNSHAWGINNNRQIIGQGDTFGDHISYACLWQWHKPLLVLDDVLPPASDWRLEDGNGINDAGQITGTGYRVSDPDQNTKGFFLTPIHQTIQLSHAQPGTAGTYNTLKVHGATPGAQVTFIYGTQGGGSAIPGCTLEQNALQIDSPIEIGTVTADANGVATLRGFVPIGERGKSVLIQAFVQGECGVSQLVVQRFE